MALLVVQHPKPLVSLYCEQTVSSVMIEIQNAEGSMICGWLAKSRCRRINKPHANPVRIRLLQCKGHARFGVLAAFENEWAGSLDGTFGENLLMLLQLLRGFGSPTNT